MAKLSKKLSDLLSKRKSPKDTGEFVKESTKPEQPRIQRRRRRRHEADRVPAQRTSRRNFLLGIGALSLTPRDRNKTRIIGDPNGYHIRIDQSGIYQSNGKTETQRIDQRGNSTRPYRVYVAILNQSGTGAPVGITRENTIGGTPTWTRITAGYYRLVFINSTIAITQNKTLTFPGGNNETFKPIYVTQINDNDIEVFTYDGSLTWPPTAGDNIMDGFCLEVRVYP